MTYLPCEFYGFFQDDQNTINIDAFKAKTHSIANKILLIKQIGIFFDIFK